MFAAFERLGMFAEQKGYERRKLQHREILENYKRVFGILIFARLGRVSILQITVIS